MMVDASAEVAAMEEKQRVRWLTAAEAQRLRKQWDATRAAMDKLAEDFDADPNGEGASLAFVVMAVMTSSAYAQHASDAATSLRDLMRSSNAR